MIFKQLYYSWLFALAPLLIGLFYLAFRLKQNRLNKFTSRRMMPRLIERWSQSKRFWKKALILIALIAIIFSILRPQYGLSFKKTVRRGQDIMIALDTSKSMLAQDIKPNRFDYAKQEILGLIDNLKGDRIGLIVFAGKSYIQCPLTSDYGAVKLFLEDIAVGHVPQPGSNLSDAIAHGSLALRGKNKKFKALVLFTDGEYFETDPEKEVEKAVKRGIKIYPVGIGTPSGEPIPIIDDQGKNQGYKRNKQNEIILSKLNESLLQKIAAQSKGLYFNIQENTSITEPLYKELSKEDSKSLKQDLVKSQKERYQWVLIIAFLALFFENFLSERKGKKRGRGSFFLFLLTGLFFIIQNPIHAANYSEYSHNKKGVNAYQEKNYTQALESFSEALSFSKDSDPLHYNLGNVFYKESDYENAQASFEKAIGSKNPLLKSAAFYNLGNVAYQKGLSKDAIASFKQALLLNPSDEDARYNLETLLIQEQQKQEQQQDQNKDNKNNKDNKKDKKNDKDNQKKNQDQNKDKNKDSEKEKEKQKKERQEKAAKQENIERILNALEQKEKDARKRFLQRQVREAAPVEKDW